MGFGFWVLGFGFWVLSPGFWVLGSDVWVEDLGFRGFGVKGHAPMPSCYQQSVPDQHTHTRSLEQDSSLLRGLTGCKTVLLSQDCPILELVTCCLQGVVTYLKDIRGVPRARGGLASKAHRLLYHSTLGSRVITKKKKYLKDIRGVPRARDRNAPEAHAARKLVRHLRLGRQIHVVPPILPRVCFWSRRS